MWDAGFTARRVLQALVGEVSRGAVGVSERDVLSSRSTDVRDRGLVQIAGSTAGAGSPGACLCVARWAAGLSEWEGSVPRSPVGGI